MNASRFVVPSRLPVQCDDGPLFRASLLRSRQATGYDAPNISAMGSP